jgi:hypothetical protein
VGQVEARLANLPLCLIGMEACVGSVGLLFLQEQVRQLPEIVLNEVDDRSYETKSVLADGDDTSGEFLGELHELRHQTPCRLSLGISRIGTTVALVRAGFVTARGEAREGRRPADGGGDLEDHRRRPRGSVARTSVIDRVIPVVPQ